MARKGSLRAVVVHLFQQSHGPAPGYQFIGVRLIIEKVEPIVGRRIIVWEGGGDGVPIHAWITITR